MRIRNLVVLVVAVNEILQNSTALKDADLLAVGELVSEGGDATVGVDLEEPGLLLLILHHLDGVDLVVKAELLEKDGGFDAIGRADGVEGDVCLCFGGHGE